MKRAYTAAPLLLLHLLLVPGRSLAQNEPPPPPNPAPVPLANPPANVEPARPPDHSDLEMVMEPGQDQLVDNALQDANSPYPGDCDFKSASVGLDLAICAFNCGGKELQVRLRHKDSKTEPGIITPNFSVSADKDVPDAVVRDLITRLAAVEDKVVWKPRKDVVVGGMRSSEGPPELAEAWELIKEGNRERGFNIIMDLMRAEPNWQVPMALMLELGRSKLNEGEVRDWFKRADANPNDTALQYAASVVAYTYGDYPGISPDLHREMHQKAVDYMTRLTTPIDSDIYRYKILSESYFVLGKQEEAEQQLALAEQLDKNDTFIHLNLTRARVLQHKDPQAAALAVETYMGGLAEQSASNPDMQMPGEDMIKKLEKTVEFLRSGKYTNYDLFFDRDPFDPRPLWRKLDYPLLALLIGGIVYWVIRRNRQKASETSAAK